MTKARDNANADGLDLISTSTFSAVTSIQFDNVFSSAYDNYKAVVNISSFSANDQIAVRFVDGTSPVTTQNYIYSYTAYQINAGTYVDYSSTAGTTYIAVTPGTTTSGANVSIDIYNPNLSQRTTCTYQGWGQASQPMSVVGAASLSLDTVLEGIRFYPGSGNFTGKISIYGYRK